MANEVEKRDQRSQEWVGRWVGERDFPEEEGPGGTLQRTLEPHESMKPGPKMDGPQVRAVEKFLKHPL